MEQAQSEHDELRCYFADHRTMQIRPATTYYLSDKSRICLLEIRDAPNCEFEAIRQHVRNMKPYMLTAQHNDDSPDDHGLRALCNGTGFDFDTSLGFGTNLLGLIRSFAETGEDLNLHFDTAKRVAEAAVESAITRFQRTGSARRWDGIFFTTWSTPLTGNLAKVDRKKAEQINQELQKKLCQTFQTEAAIEVDLACDQDRVLREHCLRLPEVTEPPDLLENYEPRHLDQEEDEDDETETARTLSERELFRQHRNVGHPQPTELARAFRHAGARRETKHYGWPEIIVHDQGPEFMGNEFQNPAGAAGVLTMPIDSQSPWQNGKTNRAGQSFKHQLWDLDEECHTEGETEFEAAVAECCDARNRYCNRSGFSAHQRVFGSSLRLPGSLLSDDPIDRQVSTADPYTNFHRQLSENGGSTSGVQTKFCTSQPREKTSMRETRPWCGATRSFNWEKRLDWTRRCCCSVTNANIVPDLHTWMLAEVLE